jgi:hypothetical protein
VVSDRTDKSKAGGDTLGRVWFSLPAMVAMDLRVLWCDCIASRKITAADRQWAPAIQR